MANAQEIARTLEYLPVPIDHAGAYIAASCYSPAIYRATTNIKSSNGWDTRRITTWNMSFDAIQSGKPGAAGLLRLCNFLAVDDIPDVFMQHGRNFPEGGKCAWGF